MSHTVLLPPVRNRVSSLSSWFTLLVAAGAVLTECFAAIAIHLGKVHVIGMVVAASLASLAGASTLIRRLHRPWTKAVAAVSFVVLTAGCALGAFAIDSLDSPRRGALETLIRLLKSTGYYRYAAAPSAGSGWPASPGDVIFSEVTHRLYSLEAQEFPQGGATRFLLAIAPFLAEQGIRIKNVSDSIEIGGKYTLRIDGVEHVLYSGEEARAGDLGRRCVNRVCGVINTLLERAHSEERLRVALRGNARYFLFLTEEQRVLLRPYATIQEALD